MKEQGKERKEGRRKETAEYSIKGTRGKNEGRGKREIFSYRTPS